MTQAGYSAHGARGFQTYAATLRRGSATCLSIDMRPRPYPKTRKNRRRRIGAPTENTQRSFDLLHALYEQRALGACCTQSGATASKDTSRAL
jgi:hypothetical protein